ncbi:MAG TPA: hypothetical protein HPQ04_02385 [Rhodospirillaceae bacterium]|nr:hypothetical protein [Rhodospirillaceae bacterium]
MSDNAIVGKRGSEMIAVRAARPEDSAEILRLLRLLAAYEGDPGAGEYFHAISRSSWAGTRLF